MNTCDELLATEMIFNNILEPLDPAETVAILSALICQDKSKDEPKLSPQMNIAKEQIENLYATLKITQEELGIVVNEDFKPSVNFTLVGVVYEWARGVCFRDISTMTDVQEGSIVRCITRLTFIYL